MKVKDFRKILSTIYEKDILFDEPHFTKRCIENNITKEKVINILIYENDKLSNIIEDRSKVYKLYFKLSNRRQLKLIADLLKYGKITLRTVKILDRKLYKKIKTIRRRK